MDRFTNEIDLIQKTIIKDEFFQEKIEIQKTRVFAKIKSVFYQEIYTAKNSKFNPSIVFVVNEFEYNNEEEIEYSNKNYSIIRTFLTKQNKIELVCQEKTFND